MPRFYFDLRDNGELNRDDEGKEMESLEEAIAHARKSYGDQITGPGENGQEPAFRVEIRSGDDELPSFVLDPETASS